MKLGDQDGFMYVEILVSMLILSMALASLVPMFIMAHAQNAAARDFTLAVALTQDKVEELKVTDFATLTKGSDSLVSHGIAFVRSWSVTPDSPHNGMKSLTVTVTPVRNQAFGQTRSAVVSFNRAF